MKLSCWIYFYKSNCIYYKIQDYFVLNTTSQMSKSAQRTMYFLIQIWQAIILHF